MRELSIKKTESQQIIQLTQIETNFESIHISQSSAEDKRFLYYSFL